MDEKKELEELPELCKKEGIELPEELLDGVAGGTGPIHSSQDVEKLKMEELRRRGLLEEEEKKNRPPRYPSL